MIWILVSVIVIGGIVVNIWANTNKKREKYLQETIAQMNLISEEQRLKEEGFASQLENISKQQQELQGYKKQNEVVLYGVREQTLDTIMGYRELDQVLYETLQDEEIHEFGDVQRVYQMQREINQKRMSLENWFQQSFHITVDEYVRRKENYVDGFPFTLN